MLDKAPHEFRDYCDCLDYHTLDARRCRKEGKALEAAAPLAGNGGGGGGGGGAQ
jgi:hypothetical protein